MKRTDLSLLVPGMITGEDVYSYNNQLIVPRDVELTDKTITLLEFYSIDSIFIQDFADPISLDVKIAPDIEETEHDKQVWPYSKAIQSSAEFIEFKQNYDETVQTFKDSINQIVEKGVPIEIDSLLDETLNLFSTSSNPTHFFNMIHNMRQYDDLTFAHSINVALICYIIAGWLHMPPEEIELATACGLFHDVGKLAIPDDIVKKPAKLTAKEYTIIKTHAIQGYSILKEQDISLHIKNAALMHHERCDGSGYPLGLTGDKIDKYAKIVSIADVYDAMTAARVYRGPLCPFTVIEIFEKEGFQKYEVEYIMTFLENVVMSYMNNSVLLSDGRKGDIVFINKAHLSKPMINCNGTFVDLSKEGDLSIEAII